LKTSITAKQTELLNIFKQENTKKRSKINTVVDIQAEQD
jgi:hypothetical protein